MNRLLRVPVSNDGKAVKSIEVLIDPPLTPGEWDAFMKIMETMKPGLVYPDEEPPKSSARWRKGR